MKNTLLFLFLLLLGSLSVYSQNEEFNRCSHLTLKNNGDTVNTAFCAKYHSKEYSFQTSYVNNEPFALRIYRDDDRMVAEFMYWENEWKKWDYHCKSVAYRNRLLKIYLREKISVQYEQVSYRD